MKQASQTTCGGDGTLKRFVFAFQIILLNPSHRELLKAKIRCPFGRRCFIIINCLPLLLLLLVTATT